jgi:hypothetical protein
MGQPVSLLLGVHAHQPVGNFDPVIEDAHERCYRPFLQTLYRYPGFRFSVHFSGWLLDRLVEKYPQDIALLHEMVARGQAETFGSGDCEPVLAAIPTRDRIGQLRTLSEKLHRQFGARPKGAWLTERVWESSIVPALADCGIRYVAVDDYHFLCTGKTAAELDNHYTTEEDGRQLDLFPISEQLRYRLPFSPAKEAVAYLEKLAHEGHRAAVYFDDIEKFGIWPDTYEWVYDKGWLEQFINGVLASPRITTSTYEDFHAAHATRGVVYLPTTSYIEMNEWTLPAPAAVVFAEVLEREKREGRFEQTKAFVRGGIWRNFFSRYPESNWMHKRMLQLSQRLAALPESARTPELTAKLYRAQANDAYWHGLFGGLYLPHLRRAVWRNLIELEAAIDAAAPRQPLTRADIDCDGADEIFIHNTRLQAVLRADGQATVHELDSFALAHNFGDTLRRGPEHYYGKVSGAPAHKPAVGGSGIASAHDRVSFKHDIGAPDIVADARPRSLFLDNWRPSRGTWRPVTGYQLQQLMPPLYAAQFETSIGELRVAKRIALEGPRLVATYRFSGDCRGTFSTELNIAVPSCDGYGGRYVLADGNIPCGFGQELEATRLMQLTLDDGELCGSLLLSTSAPVDLRARPHHTVSQSEAGFEKIMQAATLTVSWPLTGNTCELTLTLEVVPNPGIGEA